MKIEHVAVTHIDPNPDNPRRDLGNLDDLIGSIRRFGILNPLTVRRNGTGDTYQLIAGHRRLAAAIRADFSTVPVTIVDEVDDRERLALALIENLHRRDIDPVDEAEAYGRLVSFGWKQKDIAEAVDRSPAHVSKRLRLLGLPDEARGLVREGELSVDMAYEVAAAADKWGLDGGELAAELVSHHPAIRDRQLDAVIEDVKWEEKKRAFIQSMVAAGHRRLEPETHGQWEAPKSKDAHKVYFLGISETKHQKEPCSGFIVTAKYPGGEREPAAEWYCTDPNRHLPDGDSKLKSESPEARRMREEAEQKEAEKARRARRKHRAGYIQRLFTDPAVQSSVDYDQVVDRAYQILAERVEVSVAKRACGYLSLEPVSRGDYEDWRGTLVKALDQDLYRTLLAIAVAHGEACEATTYLPIDAPGIQAHLEFMAGLGYTSDQELEG